MASRRPGGNKKKGGDKKAEFWEGITQQKLATVRWGLANAGCEAQTRDDEGLTSIMFASTNGKAKSLGTIVDFYERRRVLRAKGWLDLRDDEGRTAIMMACARGHTEVVKVLLQADASLVLKDETGMTARDWAAQAKKKKCLELIDEHLAEDESEDEFDADGVAVPDDGLTSTQRNKLKKRAAQAAEGSQGTDRKEDDEGAAAAERARCGDEASVLELQVSAGPPAVWAEVANVIESVVMLRPLCELSIERDPGQEDGRLEGEPVDPALWHLACLNRLQLRLAPGALVSLPPKVSLLQSLSILILSHNSLTALCDEIGDLAMLRVLEVDDNNLTDLPASIGKLTTLETVNLSTNKLTSLQGIRPLENLSAINCDRNRLTALDLDMDNLGHLKNLSAAENMIVDLPEDIGLIAQLGDLNLRKNQIEEIPLSFAQLKKLRGADLSGNPLADKKVMKMLERGGKGLKELSKYLPKQEGRKAKGKKKNASVLAKAAAAKAQEESGSDSEIDLDDI